jgi:hypothetical protein
MILNSASTDEHLEVAFFQLSTSKLIASILRLCNICQFAGFRLLLTILFSLFLWPRKWGSIDLLFINLVQLSFFSTLLYKSFFGWLHQLIYICLWKTHRFLLKPGKLKIITIYEFIFTPMLQRINLHVHWVFFWYVLKKWVKLLKNQILVDRSWLCRILLKIFLLEVKVRSPQTNSFEISHNGYISSIKETRVCSKCSIPLFILAPSTDRTTNHSYWLLTLRSFKKVINSFWWAKIWLERYI